MPHPASFHALNVPSEARRPSPPPYLSSKGDLDSFISLDPNEPTLPVEIKLRKASTYSHERRHSHCSLRSSPTSFSLLKPNALTKGPKSPPATGMINKTSVSVIPTGPVFEDPAIAVPSSCAEGEHSDSDCLWLVDQSRPETRKRGTFSREEVVEGPTSTPISTTIPPSPDDNARARPIGPDDPPTTETSSSTYSSQSSTDSMTKLPNYLTRRSLISPAKAKRRNARKVFITAAGLSLVPQDSLDIAHKRFAQGGRIQHRPREDPKSRATTSVMDPSRPLATVRPGCSILRGKDERPLRALSADAAPENGMHVRILEGWSKAASHDADNWWP